MKYIVDTEAKTITLEGSVSVKDLILQLQASLVDWEEYTIQFKSCLTLSPNSTKTMGDNDWIKPPFILPNVPSTDRTPNTPTYSCTIS